MTNTVSLSLNYTTGTFNSGCSSFFLSQILDTYSLFYKVAYTLYNGPQ